MRNPQGHRRTRFSRRKVFAALAAILILLAMPVFSVGAVSPRVHVTNAPGFGNPNNSFAWSMAWFNGKLYVGTVKNEECLELQTLQFYYPDKGYYKTNPEPNVTCPTDFYSLDLRAEIWQYTPLTGRWVRVYVSPVIPNPAEPGKYIARDIAYRGMVVYNGALYVGAVTPNEFLPQLNTTNPPRILRTYDGTNFTRLNGSPGEVYEVPRTDPEGNPLPALQYAMGYRSMVVFHNKLYVTASTGLRGDGVVMEVDNPASANPTFTQVSPLGTMGVFEMQVFDGDLYVGTGDLTNGYGVYKTNGLGPAPFQFTPIVTGGAGRGQDITSVVSMGVYQNRLYVGASGWYSTKFPASELIRIAPDNTWQLVVGNARQVNNVWKFPISGLPDGFGSLFNAHFWRMDDHLNALYVGTNDWSWEMMKYPGLNALFSWEYGFDVYATCNGNYWFPLTVNAFGTSPYNFGARTIVSSPTSIYLGTANQAQGTYVLQSAGLFRCLTTASSASGDTAGSAVTGQLAPPDQLQADVESCGTTLSWNASANATTYKIYRSVMPTPQTVGLTPPTNLHLDRLPNDLPMVGLSVNGMQVNPNGLEPGPFTAIGTTSQTQFVDQTAKPGVRYAYEVVAEASGQTDSLPSNVVVVPSESPEVTFGQVSSTIQGLSASNQLSQSSASNLLSQVNDAQTAANQSNQPRAIQLLTNLFNQLQARPGTISDQTNAQDLGVMINTLKRQQQVSSTVCTTPSSNSGSPSSGSGTNSGGNTSSSPWGEILGWISGSRLR